MHTKMLLPFWRATNNQHASMECKFHNGLQNEYKMVKIVQLQGWLYLIVMSCASLNMF